MSSQENTVENQEREEATDDKVEITRADSPETEDESGKVSEEPLEESSSSEEEQDSTKDEQTEAPDDSDDASEEETDAMRAERLESELVESKDKYVRLMAEFENFKRRSTQEMQSRFKFASQSLATNMLSGLDSLERAIEQAQEEENESLKEFVTGIEMAKQQFYEAFSKNNIERIVPKGELFDPNRHEAMGVIDTDEVEPDHIAEVFQAGYLLHDRVIRPAMVQVAKKNK
jgi:molecular chaperone GrpE